MKRSRYSATMSRCFGSSNQSGDRTRGGSRAEALRRESLWPSRYVDSSAEQSARARLLLALLGVERDMRGGDVERPQVIAAERRLRPGGAWQAQRCQQFALG